MSWSFKAKKYSLAMIFAARIRIHTLMASVAKLQGSPSQSIEIACIPRTADVTIPAVWKLGVETIDASISSALSRTPTAAIKPGSRKPPRISVSPSHRLHGKATLTYYVHRSPSRIAESLLPHTRTALPCLTRHLRNPPTKPAPAPPSDQSPKIRARSRPITE